MKYACTMQCARDEDACVYAHARAVRLGTHGMRMRTQATNRLLHLGHALSNTYMCTQCICVAHAGALIWSKSAAGRDARAARPTSGGFRPAMPLRRMSTVTSW